MMQRQERMTDTDITKSRKEDRHRYYKDKKGWQTQIIQWQERMLDTDNTKTRKDDRHRNCKDKKGW